MKAKTIKAVLSKKFNDFLESIEDEKVKQLVEKNSIITGGAIASMLLKEKVNDFDIYFTNYETVKAIVNYYVDKFIKLNPHKLEPEVVFINNEKEGKRVKIKIKSAGVESEVDSNDLNYEYFEETDGDEAIEYIDQVNAELSNQEQKKPKYRPVFMSSNAITLSNDIQLIIRFYGEAEKIHENFDFVHCMNLWGSKDKKLQLKATALTSLLTKELRYYGSKYPIASLIRMRKYIGRGWTIQAGQILKMAMQISELDLTDVEVLEEQLTGVDFAYFVELIEILKNKKQKNIDLNYVIAIIDKMF